MKTLNNHTILYDANCPLCRLYTGSFVRAGLLDREGRRPYQELPDEACPLLDRDRAVNEIALVNRDTGAVTYGVDSLFRILGHRWPVLRPLFTFRPFAGLAAGAYAFISYNRRMIIPAAVIPGDRAPAYSRNWRTLYLLFCWLLTSMVLGHWSDRLSGLIPHGNLYREFLVCGGQVVWQAALLTVLGYARRADYLGNLMTVSLAGALALLLLGLVLYMAGSVDPRLAAGVFGAVAGLMFLEHARRCRLLELPAIVSASWVAYRLLLLYILLK